MRIKNKLIISYIAAMLAPILGLALLLRLVIGLNKEIEFKDYINSMEKFGRYEEVLSNIDIYNDFNEEMIKEISKKENIKINIYDKDGGIIYSSIEDYFYISLSKEALYKNLYKFDKSNSFITSKKPVFDNDDIVGFYEVTIPRTEWIKGLNNKTITTILSVAGIFIVVLVIIIRVINKKINLPISLLVKSMQKFSKGEDHEINYHSNDEIGQLVIHFNNMKKEIKQKNEELREEQKSREFMIAAVSHDLKTPLTSIRAYTELIKRNNTDNDENKKYTKVILNKCDHMTKMVENLLAYSVLTSEYEMDFVVVEGEEFFEMLLTGYDEVCEAEEIEYIKEVKVTGDYKVDVSQMIRVVDNLMSNAIRYTQKGRRLYLGVYSDEFNLPDWINNETRDKIERLRKDRVSIIVKNEGEIIESEDIKNIFNPFYKADNSRQNTKNSGTGLGLSVVNLIMKKHGGEILLNSEEQETTFAIFIKKSQGDLSD